MTPMNGTPTWLRRSKVPTEGTVFFAASEPPMASAASRGTSDGTSPLPAQRRSSSRRSRKLPLLFVWMCTRKELP
jgi:hypothetical protein